MARTGLPAARQVTAVERAIVVLDALAEAGPELGTNELARRTGINVSSISRILSTLTSAGIVHHVESTGRYRLGTRLIQLGNAARDGLDVRGLARPHMEELAAPTGETVTLSVPGTREVMTLDFVQSPLSVRSVAEVGRPSVAHATAVGKIFLAYEKELPGKEDLTAYTSHTITDPQELATEITKVREQGWAQAVKEREDDLHGIAAPVLDPSAHLIAILGVQGPAARFTGQAMDDAVQPLLERAAMVASTLT